MIKHPYTGTRLEQFATQGHVRNRTQALLVAWVFPSGMIWAKSFPFGLLFFFPHGYTPQKRASVALL